MGEKQKIKLRVKLAVIFSSIIVAIGVILCGAIGYFRLPVSNYYSASEKAFKIPEIGNGYVPQGICYDKERETFILSGYMKDHSKSPVYLVKNGELIKKVTLKTPDGKDYVGHGGGIDFWGDFLYVTGGSDCCIYVYSYNDLVTATNGDSLSCLGAFSLMKSDTDYIGNAFVTVCGDRLITGEFYRAESYPTPESHKITTKTGDYNQALAVEYNLDATMPLGIASKPIKAYSMPDQVQGLTVDNGKIYLSTSWGLSFSKIYEFSENNLVLQGEKEILGENIPLYAMDSASLNKIYKIAPMSEEMVMVDGELYVNCESASDKYIFGKLTGGKWLYKTNLSKMK